MRKFLFAAALALSFGMAGWSAASAQSIDVSFSLKEKQIIASFYAGGDSGNGGKKKNKGKGKGVGNQGIPPGLARKGGALPPGIAKRQLPNALLAQLPPAPKGYERVIVDNDVLLVEVATQIVHDVLTDIIH